MIPIDNFLVLSAILFSLGMYGVLARRNAVLILMSVELMLQAVAINFVAFAVYLYPETFTGVIFAMGPAIRVFINAFREVIDVLGLSQERAGALGERVRSQDAIAAACAEIEAVQAASN